jgi:polyhydroxyalkanoate synthase
VSASRVRPRRSTYKINLQVETEVTYLLTSGGHNAGIVSEPDHSGRRFRVTTKKIDNNYLDPDRFLAEAPRKDGFWWPEWSAWLSEHSGALAVPPPIGAPLSGYPALEDAPGTYVLAK